MNSKNAGIYVITGPCGVGKSTISKIIASNIENSALIEGDSIYNMVIGGRVKPWEDDGTYLELFWENVLAITENFLKRNISVILDYIIYPEHTKKIIDKFREKNVNIKYVVLMTDKNTIVERDRTRPIDCRMGERSIELLNEFKELNIDNKFIFDTTDLGREEILKTIMIDKGFLL